MRHVDPEVDAVRGQYTAGLVDGEPRIGYRAEPGVDPTSHTDTFAAVRLHVDTWRWEGVPVLLRSGKRLAAKAHEVVFRFREPPTRLFRHTPLEHAEPNWLVFRMSPSECTELVVRTKQPGLELEARESVLRAEYAERRRPARRAPTSRCCSTCWRATTRRSCASTRSSGRGASSTRSSRRGQHGAPEDYVAGSDGPPGQHRFLGPGHYWRPLQNPVS